MGIVSILAFLKTFPNSDCIFLIINVFHKNDGITPTTHSWKTRSGNLVDVRPTDISSGIMDGR